MGSVRVTPPGDGSFVTVITRWAQNAFFVGLAAAAMQVTRRGGDEALIEWRSALACARGRCRPDGYGCYRRGPWRFGFFLEYDRGTERPGQYAAKLAAYYRYRDSGDYRHDYTSLPTVLVVTTSDVAEARLGCEAYLAAHRHTGTPLQMLLTTIDRIQARPEGVLGPIWRTPGPEPGVNQHALVYWLPGRPRLYDAMRNGSASLWLAHKATR